MSHRSQSVLVKVWLALACALAAGFSGYLLAQHGGHQASQSRHARATNHRNPRFGRDGYGDFSADAEILHEEAISTASVRPGDQPGPPGGHAAPAVLPSAIFAISPNFIQTGWAHLLTIAEPDLLSTALTPARAPPTLS